MIIDRTLKIVKRINQNLTRKQVEIDVMGKNIKT